MKVAPLKIILINMFVYVMSKVKKTTPATDHERKKHQEKSLETSETAVIKVFK